MKLKQFWLAVCLGSVLTSVIAKNNDPNEPVSLAYYLPNSASYQKDIPKPQDILGFQVGEWHARPDQIERYFFALAKASPRVKVKVIGHTHEKRPLIHVYISSPKNIQQLDQLKQQRAQGKQSELSPLITWMGYGVHGNEPSTSNSAILFGYHLAAAQDPKTLQQLDDQIILIDPMLNPDGLARFVHWVNSYKGKALNSDPKNIEHNEAWPRGRTNHYWFDLNRDWLLLQHPESRARVTEFHQWYPHILTDFHEMGTNSTYFFQPGVPSRQNPLTPEANFKMTATIAKHHAKALDAIGSLYYTKESFDDFYYGKGSTYPDIHGAVGILFEQASSRGHLQDSVYGTLSFPFTIKNQLTTSLSTIEAAQQNQAKLKDLQQDFWKGSEQLAKDDKNSGIIVGSIDQYRLNEFAKILKGHNIQFKYLNKQKRIKNKIYRAGKSLVIDLRQKQYRLIQSLFEKRTQFKDSVFYDVSAWHLPLAMDLDYAFLSRSDLNSLNTTTDPKKYIPQTIADNTIALAFDWSNFNTIQLLSLMQQSGLRVQGATKPTQLKVKNSNRSSNNKVQALPLGSLVLPLNSQEKTRQEILQWLMPQLAKLNVQAIQITSGLAVNGIDMGSPSLPVLKKIKPLLLIGSGASSYSAGATWHLLDQRLSQPLTMMTYQQLKRLPEINYTHIILAGGNPSFDDSTKQKIAHWVKQGGTLITHSSASKWLLSQKWTSSQVKEIEKSVDTKVAYKDKGQTDAKHYIGGAITAATIDTSHPLGFGLDDKVLAIFKRGQLVFTEPKEAFVSVARFDKKPLEAGYISKQNRQHISEASSILVQGLGRGHLIAFSDDPVFRGYWLGTAKVFANALYYAKAIRAPQKTKEKVEASDKK